MNDDIKEILDKIKEIYDIHEQIIIKYNNADEITFFLSIKEGKLLLDYITNLKQFIKDCGFENIQQLALDYIGIRQEKEDYKSRIEKAVEYIELNTETTKVDNVRFPFELKELNLSTACRERLLNILNGRSDE